MKNNLTMTVLASAFALMVSNGALAATDVAGEEPILKPGNFVSSSDNQICYDIFGEAVTEDMVGFKVDSGPKIDGVGQQAGDFDNGEVAFDVSVDSKTLSWTAIDGVQMLGVIVKGGTNHNLYDYVNAPPEGNPYLGNNDSGLIAPLLKNGKPAGISHYNVCYLPEQGGDEQGEGCSPGYWTNHTDRWAGAATGDEMNATFGVAYFGDIYTCTGNGINKVCSYSREMTLGDAMANPPLNKDVCPDCDAFAFHAVAALLNSLGGTENPSGGNITKYPYTTDDVKADVGKVEDGEMTEAEFLTKYDVYGNKDQPNVLWCPLTGTPAN